jgi:hypothetical protein
MDNARRYQLNVLPRHAPSSIPQRESQHATRLPDRRSRRQRIARA